MSEGPAGADDRSWIVHWLYDRAGHRRGVQDLLLCREADNLEPADVDDRPAGDASALAAAGTWGGADCVLGTRLHALEGRRPQAEEGTKTLNSWGPYNPIH